MISFENVRKTYPAKGGIRVILRRTSFVIPPGKNLAVIGGNGAGKSTLVRLIAGTELPDSGRITRKGRISWPLGFSGGVHRQLTGRQNARFIAKAYGCDPNEVIDFVEDFSELGNYLDMPVAVYSSGMRSRLSFGISMAIKFDTYLIDETTAVGDSRFRRRCDEVFEARRRDANILMVSHSGGTLRKFCDIGAILQNGELVFYPTVDEALDAYDRLNSIKPGTTDDYDDDF